MLKRFQIWSNGSSAAGNKILTRETSVWSAQSFGRQFFSGVNVSGNNLNFYNRLIDIGSDTDGTNKAVSQQTIHNKVITYRTLNFHIDICVYHSVWNNFFDTVWSDLNNKNIHWNINNKGATLGSLDTTSH